MDNESIIQINPSEEYQGKVALPFDKSQFQNFIIGLLGKPQVINKRFLGSFEIDMDFVANLFQLLEQRIHQQNEAKLLELRSAIIYHDGSSVSLSGFEHLINFNEPQPLVCKALHLTWQYLILFKDKESAEKQEITISFITSGASQLDEEMSYNFRSSISIRIAHTARTWGADIEGLLTKHLTPILIKDIGLKKIHELDDTTVQNIIKFILITITTTCGYYWIDFHKTYLLIFLYALTFALTALTDLIISSVRPDSHPSFILITNESKNQKTKDLKQYNREWLKFIFATLGSIAIGIIGNFVYAYLAK
jgi:hypothetical protein